jgi:hypothetical protein
MKPRLSSSSAPHRRDYHRYCKHCGWGFTRAGFRSANFCPRCGESLHPPQPRSHSHQPSPPAAPSAQHSRSLAKPALQPLGPHLPEANKVKPRPPISGHIEPPKSHPIVRFIRWIFQNPGIVSTLIALAAKACFTLAEPLATFSLTVATMRPAIVSFGLKAGLSGILVGILTASQNVALTSSIIGAVITGFGCIAPSIASGVARFSTFLTAFGSFLAWACGSFLRLHCLLSKLGLLPRTSPHLASRPPIPVPTPTSSPS